MTFSPAKAIENVLYVNSILCSGLISKYIPQIIMFIQTPREWSRGMAHLLQKPQA